MRVNIGILNLSGFDSLVINTAAGIVVARSRSGSATEI